MIHGLNGSLYDVMITYYDTYMITKILSQKVEKILGKNHC